MPRLPRASGILLHPTSLPGEFGIGDIGKPAREFVDFLVSGGQTLWQVLPLNPTGFGNSPYASPSAFAGNPFLVALEPLVESHWLGRSRLSPLAELPSERVEYARLAPLKTQALLEAFEGFHRVATESDRERFATFQDEERLWLEDFALFTALHEESGSAWTDWHAPLRDREESALEIARQRLADRIEFHKFLQFLFLDQWQALHTYARSRQVRIVGDIPIFVAQDSADVWSHRELFKVDASGRPVVVAGVPPDYFSETGQLWGNPLYDWHELRKQGYAWWIARFRHLLRLVDVIRIDHFRGFQAAWEVPQGHKTAIQGEWIPGPAADLFRTVEAGLEGCVPIIAEDLGLITEDVRMLLDELEYPGMKVLQFAFGDDARHIYLPHMYEDPNCVVYTGTHDNNTTRGWYTDAPSAEREFARRYLDVSEDDIAWGMIRSAIGSIADTAILSLQDVLNLGSDARMNMPGVGTGNWEWRASRGALSPDAASRLGELTALYGRTP